MKKLTVLLTIAILVSVVAAVSAAPQPPLTAARPGGTVEHRPGASPQAILWDQRPFDGVNGLASELNTAVTDARTADDFELYEPCPLYDIWRICAHMIHTSNFGGQVEVYDGFGPGGVPGGLIGTYPRTTWAIVGTAFGYTVYEYCYDTPGLQLPPGHYWASSIGLGDGTFGDRAFFMTAGNGVVQLMEGHFLSNYFGFPNWTGGSVVYGYYTDYAFMVEGDCHPMVDCFKHLGRAKINGAPAARPGWVKVVYLGIVHDQFHQPNGGALVDGTITLPDGTVVPVSGVSDDLGRFKLKWKGPQQGTFTVCVTNITEPGCVYDPNANHAPVCLTITVP